jgi:hypothetical protein
MRPMFVSLGMDCCVKEHIKTLSSQRNTLPTNLFDYMVSSFDAVTKILGARPEKYINASTMYRYGAVEDLEKSDMRCSALDIFKSIHDLPLEYSQEQYDSFIEKLHRRWRRLFDYVREDYFIVFVHFNYDGVFVTPEQHERFFENLRAINPEHRCYLVSACFRQGEGPPNTEQIQDIVMGTIAAALDTGDLVAGAPQMQPQTGDMNEMR